MIRVGIIGLGKMGISHYAVFNAQKDMKVVAACDPSVFILAAFEKYNGVKCFKDYKSMIDQAELDCVVVATPTEFHAEIVRCALERNRHVFCEKPFSLNVKEGRELAELAKRKQLVNQVGYHCRFTGVFQKTKQLLSDKTIGDVYHFAMEVHGNVVKKKQGITWRAQQAEGGGCLYDYASHGIDLINFLIGVPQKVTGTVLRNINSRDIEDAVYTTFLYDNGISGHLSVNWCDAAYRKMENQITIWGTNGKIIANRQEAKVFIKKQEHHNGLNQGWNMLYTTDVTNPVDYYLRGEEYSAQVEYFAKCINEKKFDNLNSFENAVITDELVARLTESGEKLGLPHG